VDAKPRRNSMFRPARRVGPLHAEQREFFGFFLVRKKETRRSHSYSRRTARVAKAPNKHKNINKTQRTANCRPLCFVMD
ncbi:MAG: hypothetical protein RSE27_07495, partial [Ruthenibacterium sp.]